MSFEDIGYTFFYQKHFQITLAINLKIKFSCFKKKIKTVIIEVLRDFGEGYDNQ